MRAQKTIEDRLRQISEDFDHNRNKMLRIEKKLRDFPLDYDYGYLSNEQERILQEINVLLWVLNKDKHRNISNIKL